MTMVPKSFASKCWLIARAAAALGLAFGLLALMNPANAQNVVTSSNEYRDNVHAVYYSRDGGQTWNNVFLPGWTRSSGGAGTFSHLDSCGDPVLAFSPDGQRLYYSGLVCNFDKFPRTLSGVAVAVSSDGGASWS